MFSIETMQVTARAFENRFRDVGNSREANLEVDLKAGITGDVFEMLRVTAEGGKLKASHLDEEGRLHNPLGPAVEFFIENAAPEKWYYLHGLKVPEKLIEAPETLTKEDFINENNAEIRRTMVEHIGSDKFAKLQDLEVVDTGELNGQKVDLLKSRETDDLAREHVCFVRVTCTSTGREYNLGVPDTFNDALEALAWTFDMSADEYKPDIET